MNNPRNLALAGAGVATALYLIPGNIFNTPGTKNVGSAWSRGGGSTSHSPAIATPLGHEDQTRSNQIDPQGTLGPILLPNKSNLQLIMVIGLPTEHFKENQASQKSSTTVRSSPSLLASDPNLN
jgi:hypothetical protein